MNNRVNLIGNVGSDISITTTQTGIKVGSFSIAVTERYKGANNEQKERTDWFKIVCFGEYNNALMNLCKKGTRIVLEGSLRTRNYVDKNESNHIVTEIHLNQLYVLNKATQSGDSSAK